MSRWRYAFSLSKEEVRNAEPPGTTHLVEHDLYRTMTGTAHEEDWVQLIPQPSKSPADPLNWPRWRRVLILLTMGLYALIVDFSSAVPSAALTIIRTQISPPESMSTLTQLIAVNSLLVGTSNIFWVPLGNIFGRRAVLLVSTLFFILTSMWCGLATTFPSLLAARALQGAASGPVYTFAPEVAGDVFYMHERGRAMAFYTMCLAAGPLVGGVAGGYIAGSLGYKYIFWITTALAGLVFILVIFIVPETFFNRQRQMELEGASDAGNGEGGDKLSTEKIENSEKSSPAPEIRTKPWTYLESLKFGMYNGNIVGNFIGPWKSLAFPATWMVMLQYGGIVGGIVTISTIGPSLLSQPPYNWGQNVGLINVGGIIGVLIGAIYTYLTADYLVTRKAKKESHGFAEPETRLPALIPGLFVATTGLWMFGFCAANPSPGTWVGLAVGTGMVSGSAAMVPSIGFSYITDAYVSMRGECFVMATILRSVIAFAWTFFVQDWINKSGVAEPFGIFGMLMALFGLTALPMWLYGKRTRIATAGYLPKDTKQ